MKYPTDMRWGQMLLWGWRNGRASLKVHIVKFHEQTEVDVGEICLVAAVCKEIITTLIRTEHYIRKPHHDVTTLFSNFFLMHFLLIWTK